MVVDSRAVDLEAEAEVAGNYMDTPQGSEARGRAERDAVRERKKLDRAEKRAIRATETLDMVDASEFGYMAKMERKPDNETADPIETPLSAEFWEILSRMEMGDGERECEHRFVERVCEALSRFKDSDPIKLLWDVDGTMGCNNEDGKFVFRPSFLPLLELIRSRYINARHGFITDRGNWEGSEENKEILSLIDERWPMDRNFLLRTSSLDEEHPLVGVSIDYDKASYDIEELVRIQGNEGHANDLQDMRRRSLFNDRTALYKANTLHEHGLLNDEMVVAVDDHGWVRYLGDRGVWLDIPDRAKIEE